MIDRTIGDSLRSFSGTTGTRTSKSASAQFCSICTDPQEHMNVSILFFTRNGTRDNFFELFMQVFGSFRPRKFFRRPKKNQILADSAAIRFVQKSSKSEPSSRFFSHLKFRKSLPVSVLPKFPRQIQNGNGHFSTCINVWP